MQQVWYKMYQNDIIFAITKAAFFSDTNGLGCHYQSYFKPISQDLISLICTGGWSTEYQVIRTDLKQLDDNTDWCDLRFIMFDDLLCASGFLDPPVNPVQYIQPLSNQDMAREQAALKAALQSRVQSHSPGSESQAKPSAPVSHPPVGDGLFSISPSRSSSLTPPPTFPSGPVPPQVSPSRSSGSSIGRPIFPLESAPSSSRAFNQSPNMQPMTSTTEATLQALSGEHHG
ncbi:hypothetical protein C8Q72DRAFT_847583 [Fomitopsis betulina]|nr:hypothetical protein C8Q72DRAFT_847583 [Fomitopsis betulina]